MILSTDLSPVLRKRIKIPFRKGHEGVLKPDKVEVFPGGEGVELGYLLGIMNEDVVVTGFAGGNNGRAIVDFMDESGLRNDFVEIKDSSGEQLFIHYSDGQTFISDIKPKISRDEASQFLKQFKENLNICDIICITGSCPQNMPEELMSELVNMTSQWGRKSLVGLKGKEAMHALQGKPFLLALDIDTLENMTHLKLEYDSEIIKAARYVLDKGVEYLVIDLNEKGAIVLTGERGYRFEYPHPLNQHCTVNFGYMLGGFAAGITRGYDEETVLRLGIAGSIIHCSRHSSEVDMSDIKSLMNKLKIRAFSNI